ncbi:hypothetical protein CF8_0105 [Aeromonas phage CF8]|nr:hypothetical protein CF8_0105 [Aeromonas phage CF8]
MNINVIAINEQSLKHAILVGCNEANETELQVDVNGLRFSSSGEAHVLLSDVTSTRGLLVNKIDIASLFPSSLDISQFKHPDSWEKQLPCDSDALQRSLINFGYQRDNPVVEQAQSAVIVPQNVCEEVAKYFLLFCRVVGFWELTLEDVCLAFEDNRLSISVVRTHPIFTGSIEITV